MRKTFDIKKFIVESRLNEASDYDEVLGVAEDIVTAKVAVKELEKKILRTRGSGGSRQGLPDFKRMMKQLDMMAQQIYGIAKEYL